MFQIGQRVFQPSLIPTLVTIILLPCLLWLGFWQLDRAEQKRALLENFEISQKQPAVNITSVIKQEQLLQYQKIKMVGKFDVQHQFLLDNKVYQGKAGYHVITPLMLSGSDKVILVNRGWLPQGVTRQDLPTITTPEGIIKIFGQVKLNPGEGFSLGGDMDEESGWPRVVQSVNTSILANYLGYPILSFLVLQDAKSDTGFVRDWYIKKIVPEKSTSYAVQWFALSLALVIIYLIVNFRKITTGKNNVT
jgi:surfeit locus 1 family protein